MNKKRAAALSMIVAMVLTGCQGNVTVESLVKDAGENSRKAESVEMAMKMDLKANFKAEGMTMDIGMNMDLDMDMTIDPAMAYIKGNMSVNAMGQDQTNDVEIYMAGDGSKSTVYSKTAETGWTKSQGDSIESMMQLYSQEDSSKLIESLELSKDTEVINRIECYKLTGSIQGGQVGSMFGTVMGDSQAADMMGDLSLDNAKIPVEYYIAKDDKKPVKMTMDMKETMGEAMTESMKEAMSQFGSMEVAVDSCKFELEYVSFDTVDEITIPEEAKTASESVETEAAVEDMFGMETEAPETIAPETKTETEAETKTETENKTETSSGSDEITSAVKMEETSETNGSPLNEWLKTTLYSTEDSLYHTVYARITKITTESEDADYVKQCIEENNAIAYDYNQVSIEELELPEDVEICIADYEVYIPEDFPSADYGIPSPNLHLYAQNMEGGGFPSNTSSTTYIGLGSTDELEKGSELQSDIEYMPGNTYSFRLYYCMVEGFENYVFEGTTCPDGTDEGIVYYYLASR